MERNMVSVIIPTYNRAEMLKEAIISVLNQSYQNFEIIIIDDGSKDNTKDIVKSFKDKRLKYIWQKNSGRPASARNSGLKVAKGEYIALLDSDDIWLNHKLETQIKTFDSNSNILAVATNYMYFPSSPINAENLKIRKDRILSFKNMLRSNTINNSSVLIKKMAIDSIGLQDESTRILEDYEYWLRLLNYRDKSILVLKEILTKSRIHDFNTYIGNIDYLKAYKAYVYIYKKFLEYDRKYIKPLLKREIFQYTYFKMDKLFLQKRITLFQFLNDKKTKLIDKLMVLIEYFRVKYLRKIKLFYNLYMFIFFKFDINYN